jgi:hypothetical protein
VDEHTRTSNSVSSCGRRYSFRSESQNMDGEIYLRLYLVHPLDIPSMEGERVDRSRAREVFGLHDEDLRYDILRRSR